MPMVRSAARPSMPARWWRAAGAGITTGERSTREALDGTDVPRPLTWRAAPPGIMRCAIGREALDAGMVVSGTSIKAGGPGEALHREPPDPGDVSRSSTRRAAPP
jgi:hypothetical protein